jgi:hypothetical protein
MSWVTSTRSGRIAGLHDKREARNPIALAIDLCLVSSMPTTNERTLLDS